MIQLHAPNDKSIQNIGIFPSQQWQNPIMNIVIYKLYKLGFRSLFMISLLTILGFAALYDFLSIYAQGIRFAYSEIQIGFLECVYFSTVTFTTLGFGDFYPVGISRLFVSIEVFAGLTFFGLIISKVTAAKSEYILHRIYSGDVEIRLFRFNKRILNLKSELVQIAALAEKNPESQKIMTRILSDKKENIYEDMQSSALGLRRFIGYELYYGEFFLEISRRSIHRVLLSIIMQLETMYRLFRNTPQDLIRKHANKKRLEKTMKAYYHIAKIIIKYSNDEKNQEKGREIQRLSEKFLKEILQLDTAFEQNSQ